MIFGEYTVPVKSLASADVSFGLSAASGLALHAWLVLSGGSFFFAQSQEGEGGYLLQGQEVLGGWSLRGFVSCRT